MLQADRAKVDFNSAKKHWEVQILVGAEVIKRPLGKHLNDTSAEALKSLAVATARDEGYDVSPERVEVEA